MLQNATANALLLCSLNNELILLDVKLSIVDVIV